MKKIYLVILLISTLLIQADSSLANFKDVSTTHSNFAAINYVQSKGIVSGYPDGTYKPENYINRAEFVKIIVEATLSDEAIKACTKSPFKDVPNNAWFTSYICIAEKNGIIDGYPDGTFKLTNNIKLVEAAKIIVKGFKFDTKTDAIWFKPFIEKLASLNAIPVTFVHFEDRVTRGEMAEIIYRLLGPVKDKKSTTFENLENGIIVKDFTSKEISEMAEKYYKELEEIDDSALNSYALLLILCNDGDLNNDFVSLENNRMATVDYIKNMRDEITAKPSFQGDASLRDALAKDLQTLVDMLEKEQKALIALWAKMSKIEGDIPQELLNQENDLLDAISQKRDDAYKILHPILIGFSQRYGFSIN